MPKIVNKNGFITTSLLGVVMILLLLFVPDTLANVFLEDSSFQTNEIVLTFATFIWIAFFLIVLILSFQPILQPYPWRSMLLF